MSFKYDLIGLFLFHFLIFYPRQLSFHRYMHGLLLSFWKQDSSHSLKPSCVSGWRSISGIRFHCVFTGLFYLNICQQLIAHKFFHLPIFLLWIYWSLLLILNSKITKVKVSQKSSWRFSHTLSSFLKKKTHKNWCYSEYFLLCWSLKYY